MPDAITSRLDATIARTVEGTRRALDAAGLDRDRLGHAPRITLAVHPDDAPAHAPRATSAARVAGWTALPVTLAGSGIFPSPPPVLWLAPVVAPASLDRHAAVQAMFPEMPSHAHHRVGAWIPHITPSDAPRDPAAALAVLLPRRRPLAGSLDRVDPVHFRPVEVLWTRPLRSDPS